jgi:hypothetical protein
MTTEEMAQRILYVIDQLPGTTFYELVSKCGEEARGDLQISLGGMPNSILWVGVSEMFCDAFNLVKPQVETRNSNAFVYAMDGGGLTIPLPTDKECRVALKNKQDFADERWLPVVLYRKGEGDGMRTVSIPQKRGEMQKALDAVGSSAPAHLRTVAYERLKAFTGEDLVFKGISHGFYELLRINPNSHSFRYFRGLRVPYKDHVRYFVNRKTKERIYTIQPYLQHPHAKTDPTAAANQMAADSREFGHQFNLHVTASMETSWYYPGSTILIVYRDAQCVMAEQVAATQDKKSLEAPVSPTV